MNPQKLKGFITAVNYFGNLPFTNPQNVLLYGPSGAGKSTMLQVAADEAKLPIVHYSPEVLSTSRDAGIPDRLLSGILRDAKQKSPCILCLDHLETFFPRGKEGTESGELAHAFVVELGWLELMQDNLASSVLVVGLTDNLNLVHPTVLGSFHHRLLVDIPTPTERWIMVGCALGRRNVTLSPDHLDELHKLSNQCHGFTPADVFRWCDFAMSPGLGDSPVPPTASQLAQPSASRANMNDIPVTLANSPASSDHPFSAPVATGQGADYAHSALLLQQFAATRGCVAANVRRLARLGFEVPQARWSDVGGMDSIKRQLQAEVVEPMASASLRSSAGAAGQHDVRDSDAQRSIVSRVSRMRSGVLLYGPPGTGKTLLARALAGESSCHFITASIPDLIHSEVGGSEQAVADVFRRARSYSPAIVFLDELQAVFGSRSSHGMDVTNTLISQLALEMDACSQAAAGVHDGVGSSMDGRVVVVGATNCPELLDPVLLRPGRLEHVLYVPPPTREERIDVVDVLRRGTALTAAVESGWIADRTDRYTGADVRNLLQRAGRASVQRLQLHHQTRQHDKREQTPPCIIQSDVEEALRATVPTVSPWDLLKFERWSPGNNLLAVQSKSRG